MVTKALHTISKAEKEVEHMINNSNQQDPAEQTAREVRQIAEKAAFSALHATEQWGRKSLEHSKEFTEEISL